jgi:hypothetical protein
MIRKLPVEIEIEAAASIWKLGGIGNISFVRAGGRVGAEVVEERRTVDC